MPYSLGDPFIEPVRIVGFVADEPGGQLVEETSGKNLLPQAGTRLVKRFAQIRREEDCYERR